MDKATLSASVRDKSVLAKNLRRASLIPVEYYGKGIENMSLTVNYGDFRRLYRTAGMNTVIELDVDGKGKKNVIVHRVDTHPVTDDIAYVELINVRMDQEITANVPLRLEGQSPAVRDTGAILIQNMDEVEVTCLPAYLPHEIVVNIESLVDLGSSIHVSDLVAPANVKITADSEASVISLTVANEEEVAPVEAVDVSTVEVTTEKKDEGAAEGAATEKKEE
ncbi:50S ribosomal protein L25 [Candidatus Peregrinibacteria bacterium]|nr:MAG: 50S ribosomal protein L25 [Candidatus Peregrinibacteria bacterium]